MPTVSSGIMTDSNFLNLKAIDLNEIRSEVFDLLVDGEQPAAAFKTVRDQVIFTTKRIFVVNVQGITGKKTSYFSYPYSKIQYFGVETAGVLDIDSELILAFSNGAKLSFDFRSSVDIHRLNTLISNYVL
ncbi:MAG: PH domain-containing protein [Oscillospiraceae bacterium]|nr:PH domain-containing protein [Oscillospiraceae bacterium]